MAKEKVQKEDFDTVLKNLNKRYGVGTIISGKDIVQTLDVISTGSMTLDIATTIGGIPLGKIIEIFGVESSGKSTLTLHIISEFQKAGKKAVYCDFEHSFDKKYAESIGVDVDSLIIVSPECQEDGYNLIEELVKTSEISLVIIDSHTAMMPRKIVDGEVGEATIGLQARINSVALGKLKSVLPANNCTLISVSQLRTAIGGYGDPSTPTGGNAYKFYADMRLKVFKQLDKTNDLNKTTVDVIKNKCGNPFGKAEFNIVWGKGIDKKQEIVDLAVELDLIKKGGSWYTIPGEEGSDDLKLQGDNGIKKFLEDNPEFSKELEDKVIEQLKSK